MKLLFTQKQPQIHYITLIKYTTLAWAFKGAGQCLTRILPGQYHGKAVCQ